MPEKSVRIEIIIEKIEKNNRNPGRDDIINRFDPLSNAECKSGGVQKLSGAVFCTRATGEKLTI